MFGICVAMFGTTFPPLIMFFKIPVTSPKDWALPCGAPAVGGPFDFELLFPCLGDKIRGWLALPSVAYILICG